MVGELVRQMKRSNEAVIYPILPQHVDRLFRGKDVFCKYVGRKAPNIAAGGRLIFYRSGGTRQLVGEAKIKDVRLMTPDLILGEFRDRLFITADELEQYRLRGDRPTERKLLVLLLSEIKKYRTPLKAPKVVTMAGCVLSRAEYGRLMKAQKR